MIKQPLWPLLKRRLILHIDPILMLALSLLLMTGLIILFSATDGNWGRVMAQAANILVALLFMWLVANTPLHYLMRIALPLYLLGMLSLIAVALFGEVSHGARRWLNIGITVQPSELMKIAVPLMMAWYFEKNEATLTLKNYFIAAMLLLLPVALIARQPDLGTAVLISASGFYVLFLAGLSWRVMGVMFIVALASAPVAWSMLLHDYQKHRIMMLLDPSQDALGKGYHTIQGRIAVGSGGVLGKGYLNGTQTHLDFLPERTTDFIFAVYSEEFGLLGNLILLGMFLFIIGRGFIITANASTYFTRLMAGSITLTFFTYAFVNMGMVSGILPVVGVPLPLVSYGGTSMVTLLFGFGMLMSIHTHKTLVQT